jgi:Cu2+-exporting ATPase
MNAGGLIRDRVDFSILTRPIAEGISEMDLAIDGIDCAACMDDIEGAMARVPGVVKARLNLTLRRLTLSWRVAEVQPEMLIGVLQSKGYGAFPFDLQRSADADRQLMQFLLKCLAVAAFASMNIMLLSVSVWSSDLGDMNSETRDFFHWLSALIALPAAAYAGQPFFRSAIAALRQRSLNMDVPISLGVILALTMSVYETAHHAEHAYFDSAMMLLLFLLSGRVLDQMMRRRTRAAAANLTALRGEMSARFEPDGTFLLVPVSALRRNDIVLVRPGEAVPADGLVIAGSSQIDDSLITGETLPHAVKVDDQLYAGSINLDGVLQIRVTAGAQGSLLDHMARLIDAASEARNHYQILADRASRIYAPLVHLTALLSFTGWMMAGASVHDALIIAISVLIITCPCALALAVPAVQVVASGALFRQGIYLNSGQALERLANVDWIVFDKTGTLTRPQPGLVNKAHIAAPLLDIAARLAQSSHHPLALALVQALPAARPLDQVEEVPGAGVRGIYRGVECRLGSAAFCDWTMTNHHEIEPGASVIYVRMGDEIAPLLLHQQLRPHAAQTIAQLKEMGFKLSILSGDRMEAVAPIAQALNIADWQAGLKPEDKIKALAALQARRQNVLMVGDGLNDAPALAAANASLSPISAVKLSQAQADAVFIDASLLPVVQALRLARLARRLMQQNLILAVVYNAIAVPLAIMGEVTPLIAALAMSGSSVLVTLNALRAQTGMSEDIVKSAGTGHALIRSAQG